MANLIVEMPLDSDRLQNKKAMPVACNNECKVYQQHTHSPVEAAVAI